MSKIISLINAPYDKPLRIVEILGGHGFDRHVHGRRRGRIREGIIGGHGVHRRLLALGFHKDDVIELDSRAIFRGPVLVKNLTADVSVALGRGIAQKIMVEVIDERK